MVGGNASIARRRLLLGSAAGLACSLSVPAFAQADKSPVRLVCCYPAGGLTDAIARLMGERLAEHLGRPIVVDNRAGASGQIGAAAFSRLPPDGQSIMVGSLSETMLAPLTYRSLPYQPARDLQPVSLLAEFPFTFAVGPQSGTRSFGELVAWAQGHPREASIGTPGTGTPSYFHALMMKRLFGGEPAIAQFAGGAPLLAALSGGQLTAAANAVGPDMIGMHQSGRTRMVAVTGESRLRQFPDIPTFLELGAPTLPLGWIALFVPRGTPAAQVDYWNAGAQAVLRQAAVQQRFVDFGLVARATAPQAMQERMANETRGWGQIVQTTGFELIN